MGGYQRRQARTSPLEGMYVARIADPSHETYADFLRQTAALTAGKVAVRAAIGTHLTMLGTYGVKERMKSAGYSPRDVRQFRGSLARFLDDTIDTRAERTVHVDTERPLRWRGRWNNKLVLNVVPDEGLQAERELINRFLADRLGSISDTRPFSPHVTVGEARLRCLTDEEKADPLELFQGECSITSSVVLRGLATTLGSIHQQETYLSTAA